MGYKSKAVITRRYFTFRNAITTHSSVLKEKEKHNKRKTKNSSIALLTKILLPDYAFTDGSLLYEKNSHFSFVVFLI